MLKKSYKLSKICLSILSMTLISGTVFGFDNYGKLSYLDGVSGSYLQNQQQESASILNINSPEAQAIEARIELGGYPEVVNTDETVSLSLMNANLNQVLRMLCDKADLGYVPMSRDIAGRKVSLDLNNVNLNDAFSMIFKMCNLTFKIEKNNLLVYLLDDVQAAGEVTNISVLPVKYANVRQVASFLNSNIFENNISGLTNHAVVSANPSKNELFVFGTDNDVATIKKVLPLIDTKPLINTFKVNHTTPKEMAQMICESLFNAEFDDSNDETEQNAQDDEKITIGPGVAACRLDKLASETEQNEKKEDNDSPVRSFNGPPLIVSYFSESGKVGVYGGSVQQAELVRDFILEHDKKQLMAYVEVSVIELNESGSKTFSNTWNLWTPFISLGFDGTAFNVGGAEPFFIWGDSVNSGETTLTKTNNKALTYSLNYIIENGNGRVLSNPKIMVTNGRKAVIDMTSDYIKKTTTQILESSTSITSGSQRSYEIGDDQGIVIELVPFISPDGYVTMNLTPEFSTVAQTVTRKNEMGGEDIEATLLQRRDLELKNVRIRDGESLVLAGLIKEDENQTIHKMPLLSDLPFIGAFFRNSLNTKSREEMVIVVTPHIIKDTDELSKNDKVYDL